LTWLLTWLLAERGIGLLMRLSVDVRVLTCHASWNVPIHVDAASGGFVAPFLYPEYLWDFRVKGVVSARLALPAPVCTVLHWTV